MQSPTVPIGAVNEDKPTEPVSLLAYVSELWDPNHGQMQQVGLLNDPTGAIRFVLWKRSDHDDLVEGGLYRFDDLTPREYDGRMSVVIRNETTITREDDTRRPDLIDDVVSDSNDILPLDTRWATVPLNALTPRPSDDILINGLDTATFAWGTELDAAFERTSHARRPNPRVAELNRTSATLEATYTLGTQSTPLTQTVRAFDAARAASAGSYHQSSNGTLHWPNIGTCAACTTTHRLDTLPDPDDPTGESEHAARTCSECGEPNVTPGSTPEYVVLRQTVTFPQTATTTDDVEHALSDALETRLTFSYSPRTVLRQKGTGIASKHEFIDEVRVVEDDPYHYVELRCSGLLGKDALHAVAETAESFDEHITAVHDDTRGTRLELTRYTLSGSA
jgi:hypothetical protein